MKKILQVLAILLALGAAVQTVNAAMAASNPTQTIDGDKEPGI